MWCMRSDSTDNGTCMFVIRLLCHSLTCCVAFHRHAYFHLLSNVPYFLLFVLVKCLINIKSKVELLLAFFLFYFLHVVCLWYKCSCCFRYQKTRCLYSGSLYLFAETKVSNFSLRSKVLSQTWLICNTWSNAKLWSDTNVSNKITSTFTYYYYNYNHLTASFPGQPG